MCLTTKRALRAWLDEDLAGYAPGQTHPGLINLANQGIAAVDHAQAPPLEQPHFAHPKRLAPQVSEARDDHT